MSTTPTRSDRVRQVTVTISEVLCILGTLVGVGAVGTRVSESSGGALAADATLIAPAGPAFTMWSVIYTGLAAYTIWQWFPKAATTTRTRTTGYLIAATMLLNATWLLVTQQNWIWASVVVIAVLMATLGVTIARLTRHGARSRLERLVVDGTIGLYVGWVAVATCANVTAALVASGVEPPLPTAEWIAVGVLALAAAVGLLLTRRVGGRLAVALAMAWGLGWIAVGRLADSPESALVAAAAVVAALVVLLATAVARLGGHRPATAASAS